MAFLRVNYRSFGDFGALEEEELQIETMERFALEVASSREVKWKNVSFLVISLFSIFSLFYSFIFIF